MDAPLAFENIVAAVMAGNIATVSMIWGMWMISKAERNGGSPTDAPWSAFIAILFPGIYMLTFWSLA